MTRALLTMAVTALALWSAAPTATADPRWSGLPERCARFTKSFGDSDADWNQLLSIATCVVDNSHEDVRDPADLEAMVDRMARRIQPSLSLYATAIEMGPPDVQMRAAFHIGLTVTAFITRARASVPRELQRPLDVLLAPTRDVARVAFGLVLRFAREQPELVRNPVMTYLVETAHQKLDLLGPTLEVDRDLEQVSR